MLQQCSVAATEIYTPELKLQEAALHGKRCFFHHQQKASFLFLILAVWIPCHPNARQSDFRRKTVNKLTYGHTGVQQTDKQLKPSSFSSYSASPWIKYWPTNRTPECPFCVTTLTNFYLFIYFFQFMVQFPSLQTKRVQQEHELTLTHKHSAWPDEKLAVMAWVKSAGKWKSFFCLFVCLMHLQKEIYVNVFFFFFF